ncbi:unnamed protein product [Ectocarpus sp. 12 AP-2014]
MPNLEAVRVLDWEYHSRDLRGIQWPKGLREPTVFKVSSLDGVVIPSTVQVYRPHVKF